MSGAFQTDRAAHAPRRAVRLRAVASALLVALVCGTPVAPDVRAREDPAATIIRSARLLATEGKLVEAASLYLEAYALLPEAVLLFNAARMYQRAGRLLDARDTYRRYLAVERDAAGLAEGRERLAETLDAIPGRLRIEVTLPGTEVFVDGHVVEPGTVCPMNRGVHTLRARRTGFEPLERTFAVEPDALTRLDIALVPEAPPADVVVVGPPAPSRRRSRPPVWSWTTLGAGAATIAGGVALTLLAAHDRDRVTSASRNASGRVVGITRAEALDLRQSADRKAWASLGLYIGGGALVTTGVIGWIVSATRRDAPAEAGAGLVVAPAAGGPVFVYSGRF